MKILNINLFNRTFRWKFNNSGETLDVGKERYLKNGSRSIFQYTPVTDQDYGTVSCWAHNEVSEQTVPCLYQVVLAGMFNYSVVISNMHLRTILNL